MADDRPARPALHHDLDGAGPPVLLLHAGIADARMWDDQLAPLTRRYTVVRPELRGFGSTPALPGSFAHRDDLRDLLDALGVRSAAVVGASMGGEVAIDLAIAHPDRVGALVLAGSSLGGWHFTDQATLDGWRALGQAVDAGDLEGAARLELEMWVAGPARSLHQVDPRVVRRVHDMLLPMYERPEVEEDQPLDPPAIGRLGEIAVPTLIVVGEHDRPDMQRIAELLAAGIPRSRLAVLPACAHLPNMEQPAMFNELVVDFLASATTRRARAMGKGGDFR